MKIKWNWGTGITLFIIIFMSFTLWKVYRATQHPVMLVEKRTTIPRDYNTNSELMNGITPVHLSQSFWYINRIMKLLFISRRFILTVVVLLFSALRMRITT